MARKFPGKVPENLEIIEFPKNKPFNRKFWKFRKENQTRKSPTVSFRKLGYILRGYPLFRKFRKMQFHSSLEISANSKRNFWSKGKRPYSRSRAS